MTTKTKDRIKGYAALALCLLAMAGFICAPTHAQKLRIWHVAYYPPIPFPIIWWTTQETP